MPLAAESLVDDFRRRHSLDEHFDVYVKKIFQDNLTDQYTAAFDAYLARSNLSWSDVGSTLKVHRATVIRWMNNDPLPELKTIFRYIAARDIPISEVGFPRGPAAILGALAVTLTQIAESIGVFGGTPILPDEVDYLRFATRHVDLRSGPKAWVTTVLDYHHHHLEISVDRAVRKLRLLYTDWFIAWVLACDAIPYDWIQTKDNSHETH